MKTKENEGFWTVFWLLGPLIFYELCTEIAAWACSLFCTRNVLLTTGLGAFLAFPVLLFAYRKRKSLLLGQIPFPEQSQRAGKAGMPGRNTRTRLLRGCLFSALAGTGACLCFNPLLQIFFPPSAGWNETREAIYGTSIFLRFAVTVLLAPAAEELIFRGLIRMELKRHMSSVWAAFAGSVLFGLYHGNLSQGLYAWMLGLCLELVCSWSDSILPALSLHMGANVTALCFTALASAMPGVFGTQAVSQPLRVAAAVAAGACLAVAALYKTKEVFGKL